MSDDQFDPNAPQPGPPPGSPPPPPPPGAAPPPPPPPAAAPPPPPPAAEAPAAAYPPPPPTPAAQPAAAYGAATPPPPAKKSRAWIWVLVIAVVLGCCAIAAAAVGFGLFGASNESSAISAADAHWDKVDTALKALTPELIKLSGSSSSASVKEAVVSAQTQLDEATKEVELAKAEVAKMPASSQKRKDYEAGLIEAATTLKLMGVLMDELGGVGKFSDVIKQGVSLYKDGMSNLNKAVIANNKRKHSSAHTYAAKAGGFFRRAKAKFELAGRMDPEAGADSMLKYCDLQIQSAGMQAEMGRWGAKGNISQFNKYVGRYNNNQTKVASLPSPSILEGDYLRTRLSQLSEQITTHATNADELIAKAHAE
jgi:hypothetical protein